MHNVVAQAMRRLIPLNWSIADNNIDYRRPNLALFFLWLHILSTKRGTVRTGPSATQVCRMAWSRLQNEKSDRPKDTAQMMVLEPEDEELRDPDSELGGTPKL